jgi:hypothetical protein
MAVHHNDDGHHFVSRSLTPDKAGSSSDFIRVPAEDRDAPFVGSQRTPVSENVSPSGAVLEVVAVFDQTFQNLLGNSQSELINYAAIMFHTVNAIYTDMTNPDLEVKLAGILLLVRNPRFSLPAQFLVANSTNKIQHFNRRRLFFIYICLIHFWTS